jgi:23S rRNA (cytosine1962-C5)-methyltransferase
MNGLGHPPETAPPPSGRSTPSGFRDVLFNPEYTDAYRLVHSAADGFPGWHVDRLGPVLLVSGEPSFDQIPPGLQDLIQQWLSAPGIESVYFQPWQKSVRGVDPATLSPVLVDGTAQSFPLAVIENGIRYHIRFDEGYSIGLFLDHRENRRRWLDKMIRPGWEIPSRGELLNTFAYTCSFSIVAARIGWMTTSLDLSKKYLDWGRENFALNGMREDGQDFVFGETFEWIRRWARKGRRFDAIILDPPTFSKARTSGRRKPRVFRAEKDYTELAESAGRILRKGGLMLVSTNAASIAPILFLKMVEDGLLRAGHKMDIAEFAGQGPDFPVTPDATPHLKSFWIRVR